MAPSNTSGRRVRATNARNSRRWALLTLGAAAVIALTLGSLASARSPARVASGAHPSARALPLKMIWGPTTLPNGSSAFPAYHKLGVQVYEVQLSWADTAPTKPADPTNPDDPAYVWPTALDQAVSEASAYGISVAIMVKGTPGWANSRRGLAWAPNNPEDYAQFMQAASRRYPSVHEWMIWGETTRPGNFYPMPANSPVGPRRYAILLDDAYGALKAISPANTVIGGMTYTVGLVSPPDFVRWLRLPNGAPPRMDDWGHNPYSTRFPERGEVPYSPGVRDIDDIGTFHAEIAAAYRGRPVPKLWLSEFGIETDHPSKAFDYFVSKPVQAEWVTAAFRLVDSVSYVSGLGWYELLDVTSPTVGNLTEGLMTAAGVPKPSFYAYAAAP